MKTSEKRLNLMLWILTALALWQASAFILSRVVKDPLADKKLPFLQDVAVSFVENAGFLLLQAGITLRYASLGFFTGVMTGILLAIVMRISGMAERMILPYLLLSQMIPILGLAPIIFGLFKSLNTARVVIAAYITFFPVSVSLLNGLKSVSEEHLDLMKSCGAGVLQRYTKFLIPSSVPHLITGMKIAAPVAVSAAVLVDTLSSQNGIGYVIVLTLYGGGTTGQFWPALILSALMGLGSMLIIDLLGYLLIPRTLRRENA